jgi:hypothetical protein
MNTKQELTVNEFKKEYCQTLHTENANNKAMFVKIPVNTYTDVNLMSYYLINAIDLISQAHEYNPQNTDDLAHTLQTITKILQAISLPFESEGIDRLLKL